MKNLSFKFTVYVIIALIITSCSDSNPLEEYNCRILDSETMKTLKKTVYIQIPEQLSEQQLIEIATYLKNENTQYERLFIFYLLPEMQIGSGAWATTHYNKSLEINILGATKVEEESMKSEMEANGEIIGKWYDKSPYMEHSIVIYRQDDVYKLKETYKDGSINDKVLEFSDFNGKSKFTYENEFGEYILIESDGRLGQYDKDGLISKADIVEK
jgi:hypothetical protein